MKLTSAALAFTQLFSKSEPSESEVFADVYSKNQNLVRSVIFQIAGQSHIHDLVQETFIKVWKNLPQFRHQSEMSSWIYRIAVNVALDHLRQNKKIIYTDDLELEIDDPAFDLEKELSDKELVAYGLKSLSPDHRTVIVLSVYQDLTQSEIAKILQVSEGTIKSRLHYAKEHLKQHLAELSERKKSAL